jgi:hypothetical protein
MMKLKPHPPTNARAVPTKIEAAAKPGPLLLAKAMPEEAGVVIDYTLIGYSSLTSYTFASATTYYVSSDLYLYSYPTVEFQGGAVIKLAGPINISDPDNVDFFGTSVGNAVVFTSPDDNSVGETISGSTGSPSIGGTDYIDQNADTPENGVWVQHAIFKYAGTAYEDDANLGHLFIDCQFVQCGTALYLVNDTTLTALNILFSGVSVAVEGADDSALSIDGENVTADASGVLVDDGMGISGGFTNCIFTACDGSETSCSEDHTTDVGNSAGVFAAGGDNDYYLPVGSGNRAAGTSTINYELGPVLDGTTTYAPQNGSYLNTGTPDRGFHYPPSTSAYSYDDVPDSWEMEYFGTAGFAGGDLDDKGTHTLLYDYANSIDPNVMAFVIAVTNQYVNHTNVPLSVAIQAGLPFSVAMLVDSTNFSSASWSTYTSSNLTANLGPTNGWHTLWVGLNGRSSNATLATWNSFALDLDTNPPILILTNMSNYTGSRPYIDPAGYANKALRSLTFAVTNSLGAAAQGQGVVVDQQINPADMFHTTNWFSCVDLPLTLGTNHVSIAAVDWAGNSTQTNFAYDFDTNLASGPPVIALLWPQSGMQLSGSNCTLRGTLDDDTALVTGQYTDTNGLTQTLSGLVERGGQFWLEHVPLSAATNTITIAATNAAGLGATTNLTLYQSSVSLNMNAVSSSEADQAQVNVTGTISTSSDAVWVNGVLGTNNGDGTWAATSVPVTAGGTGTFDLAAYPPGFAPSGSSWTNFAAPQLMYTNAASAYAIYASLSIDKAPMVYIKNLNYNVTVTGGSPSANGVSTNTINWALGGGGAWTATSLITNNYTSDWDNATSQTLWPSDPGYVLTLAGAVSENITSSGGSEVTNWLMLAPPYFWIESGSASGVSNGYAYNLQASQEEYFFEGCKGLRAVPSLYVLHQDLTNVGPYSANYGDDYYLDQIPSTQIALGTLGSEDVYGDVWFSGSGGQNLNITPLAPQARYASFSLAAPIRYNLTHLTQAVAYANKDRRRTTIGVGELVNFTGMPQDTQWTNTGGSLSATVGATNLFIAPSNAMSVTVTAMTNGVSIPVTFTVLAPTGVDHTQLNSVDYFGKSISGAGMFVYVWIAPLQVSFNQVQFMEVLTNASSISGYYLPTNYTLAGLMDHKANLPIPIAQDNTWYDHAWWAQDGQPWTNGSFSWVYTDQWMVGSNGSWTAFPGTWTQQMTLTPNGSMEIDKWDHTVIRNTNDIYTTRH